MFAPPGVCIWPFLAFPHASLLTGGAIVPIFTLAVRINRARVSSSLVLATIMIVLATALSSVIDATEVRLYDGPR